MVNANLNDNTPDLSVLIMSYDGFADEWEACDYCFNKYWRVNCPVYLVTNYANPEFKFLNVFQIGDACYSNGIYKFIEQCDSEYVLLLMADFLPKKQITNESLTSLIDLLKKESIDYCSVYTQKDKVKYYKKFKNYKNLLQIDMSVDYAVNVMPAIWKTTLLKDLTNNVNLDPWGFEVSFQRESPQRVKMCNTLNVYSKNVIYPFCHTVVKGKYTRDGIKFLKKESIFQGKRKKMGYWENFKFHISNRLPRKLISKIKKVLIKFGFKFYVD